MATRGTVISGSYQQQLEERGLLWEIPDEEHQQYLHELIYGDVKTGKYFQSGHHTVIRARVEMGDYCTVTNGAVIEGMVKMGDSVRLMSHVYVASRTCFENRVICGPNVVFLNEKRPGKEEITPIGAYLKMTL